MSSMRAIAWAYKQRLGGPVEKFLLFLVAMSCGTNYIATTTVKKLSHDMEFPPDSVRWLLRELSNDGFFDIDPKLPARGNSRHDDDIISIQLRVPENDNH